MSCARTVPSKEAESIVLPFWVKQMSVTPHSCSVNVTRQKELTQFQILTYLMLNYIQFKNYNLTNLAIFRASTNK